MRRQTSAFWARLAISIILGFNICVGLDSCGKAVERNKGEGKYNVLRFRQISIQDRPDMIGGVAATMLIPADWEAEGSIVWRMHPTMPAGLACRVYNPKGLEMFEGFPVQTYSWGSMLAMTGFVEGSNYLGNEVRRPVHDAFEYIEQYLILRTRPGIRYTVVSKQELPALAEAVRAQNGNQGGFPVQVSAGKVRIEYEQNGKAVEEDFYCSITLVSIPGGDSCLWIADQLGAMRAEKGHVDENAKILETMVRSGRINLEWYNKYSQLVEALTDYQNRQIANAGVISRIISRTSDEISEMRRQSYEATQASRDRINENYDQYIRGVDVYRNPDDGTRVELPSGYNHAWRGLNDEFIVTDNPNFNPNVELKGNWTQLEPQAN